MINRLFKKISSHSERPDLLEFIVCQHQGIPRPRPVPRLPRLPRMPARAASGSIGRVQTKCHSRRRTSGTVSGSRSA